MTFSMRTAYRIVYYRVSIPTWILTYTNFVLGAVWFAYSLSYNYDGWWATFISSAWTLALAVSALVIFWGLLFNQIRPTALGAAGGFIAWTVGFLSWVLSDSAGNITVPVFYIPMLLFFAFVYFKHSSLANVKEEDFCDEEGEFHEEEKDY